MAYLTTIVIGVVINKGVFIRNKNILSSSITSALISIVACLIPTLQQLIASALDFAVSTRLRYSGGGYGRNSSKTRRLGTLES